MSPRFQFSRKLWLSAALLLAALAAAPPAASGQQTVMGRVKNFSVSPDYYDPPQQAQAKSLLQGAEAVPMAGGQQVQITQARLRTFREDGAEEMLVVAPECLYESRSRSVRSAGPLEVQTADGKFSLQGEGFSWQQTNSTLVISNQVRTRVHPSLLQRGEPSEAAAATAEEPPLEITSERFEYAREEGLGIYRGQVRVSGTNLAMSGGVLTIQMPVGGRRVQSITAEQQIAVEYSGVQASGEHAVYAADTGMVRVWGRPAWKTGQREGRAEELVIDPTNRVFLASGNGRMRLPGESLAGSGLLASGRQGSKTPTNLFVEIACEQYELRTNWAAFRRAVRVTEVESGVPRGTLTCAQMTVRFAGTNEVEELLADGGVEITQEDRRFTAERAVYHGTNGIVELTGNPLWQAGARQGQGEVILVRAREEDMIVRGRASMRLPASEFGALVTAPAALPTPASIAPPATPAAGAAPEFADVFCEEYRVSARGAVFSGGVYISHPQMNWSCEMLTVELPATGGTIERIVAQDSVSFDLADRQGQVVHGTGDRAVYLYRVVEGVTNDLVELTGNSVLQTTNGIFRNDPIILDRANSRLIAPGQYHIQGWGKVDENQLLAPAAGPGAPRTNPARRK